MKTRLVKETRCLEQRLLYQALARISTLEKDYAHLNKLLHARMADDIDFRSEFVRIKRDIERISRVVAVTEPVSAQFAS